MGPVAVNGGTEHPTGMPVVPYRSSHPTFNEGPLPQRTPGRQAKATTASKWEIQGFSHVLCGGGRTSSPPCPSTCRLCRPARQRGHATGFQKFELDVANHGALLAGQLPRFAAFEPDFFPRLIDATECGIVKIPAASPFPCLPASAASAG